MLPNEAMAVRCHNEPMQQERVRWIAAGAFAVLCILQAVKWGAMQLPIQGPLLLILIAGLVVAGFRNEFAFRNHALFVCAYGATFFLIWAVGHPGVELVPGRTWLVTLTSCCVLAVVIIWNARGKSGAKWLTAIFVTVGFGLVIALMSGPSGGPDWMANLVQKWFGPTDDQWEIRNSIVYGIRKSLHFIGYGSAALAAAIAAKKAGASVKRSVLLGIAWPLPLAVFDEYQQRFAPNRSGMFNDVLLDLSGMLTFLGIFAFVHWRKSNTEEGEAL